LPGFISNMPPRGCLIDHIWEQGAGGRWGNLSPKGTVIDFGWLVHRLDRQGSPGHIGAESSLIRRRKIKKFPWRDP